MTSEITKHIQEFDDAWHSFDVSAIFFNASCCSQGMIVRLSRVTRQEGGRAEGTPGRASDKDRP